MAQVLNRTDTIPQTVMIWYEKRFLERARAMLVHQEGGQMSGREGNQGVTTRFTRYTPRPLATTPLSESQNPTPGSLSAVNVDVTLAEYGDSVQVSRLLSTTDIDERDGEKIDVVAQNMGETLDALVRNALFAGATALPGYTAGSSNLTPAMIAQVAAVLKRKKALAYPGTFAWLGKIQPETEYDISQSTTWQNAAVYSNVNSLYEGEIGALYGTRFLVTNQGFTEGTSPLKYSNMVHGREAFGVYDNKLDPPQLYIVTGADSANPTERFHTLSWAGQFVAKVLNVDWVYNLETAASILIP
jgi:N4-gp56 family major capsid protein